MGWIGAARLLSSVEVRTHFCIVQERQGYHRPTSARRIGSGHGQSCRQRSKEERRARGPRSRMPVVEQYVGTIVEQHVLLQLQPTSRVRTAMQPADISSSSFGYLVQATIGSRSPAPIVRGQPIRVRSCRPNCLREIAVFGSIFARGLSEVSSGFGPAEPRPRPALGGDRIAGLLQNALMLLAGSRNVRRMVRSQTTGSINSAVASSRQHCCLITSIETSRQNDKT